MDPSAALFPSPNGSFVLEIFPIPMRMSHEVNCPTLYEAESRNCLFDPGSLWDASGVRWSNDSSTLDMHMRHYSNGMHGFELHLDLEKVTALLTFGDRTIFSDTFSKVASAMERIDKITNHI